MGRKYEAPSGLREASSLISHKNIQFHGVEFRGKRWYKLADFHLTSPFSTEFYWTVTVTGTLRCNPGMAALMFNV